jgi:multiple sugar transport system substrate-binding protein
MKLDHLKRCLAAAVVAVGFGAGPAMAADTVVVWHIFGNETEPGLVNIKTWNDTHPDVQIDAKFVPFGQLSQQLIKGIATGDVPDLVTIDNPTVASFANQNALDDLTDLVKDSKVIVKDNYYPGSWSTTLWKGKQYAVPGEANTLALYYNADMFRAKGLDPDKPPRTWAELRDYTERLTDRANGVYGIAFSAIQSEEGTFQWLPFLHQAGGSVQNLASPEAKDALQLWTDFVQNGMASKDVLVKRQFEMTNTWVSGNAAMVISGPWELQRVSRDVKFDWRVATLPYREGKNIEASALGGYVWAIPKGAENRELAFRVIEYMSEPAQMQRSWSGGRLPPVTTIAVDNPSSPEAYAVFTKQMEVAKPRGPHPQWPQISAAIQTAIQEALTGRSKPEQALTKASKTVGPILQKTPIEGM